VLAALTAPAADAGDLSITNVRLTHGVLGPTRSTDKVLPGDSVFLSFDLSGVTIAEDGTVKFSIGTEVVNDQGKTLFKMAPRDNEIKLSLGGNRMPGYAQVDVGLQQPPGEYTMKVTVTDRASGKSQTLSRNFTVLQPDFGIVKASISSDPDGLHRTVVPGAGEGLWVHFGVLGFNRDNGTKQPDVSVQLRILDESGKATQTKPLMATVKSDVPADHVLLPMRFPLALNRPGKFTIEVTATDELSKKTSKLTFPLTVQASE
jgi:hypothetical protein